MRILQLLFICWCASHECQPWEEFSKQISAPAT